MSPIEIEAAMLLNLNANSLGRDDVENDDRSSTTLRFVARNTRVTTAGAEAGAAAANGALDNMGED